MEAFMLQNIFNGGREAQIQAASEMVKLSSKLRQKLVEGGVILPLITMLQSQDYESIQASLFALLTLAFGSERNKRRMVKSGVVDVLLHLLQWQEESLTELTVAALLILSSCGPNKPLIASSGAIQILVDSIPILTTTQSKLDTLTTLHNLSTCNQAIPHLVSSELVPTLLQLLTQHSSYPIQPELADKAMALLEAVAITSERAVAQAAGGIRVLVEMVEEGSPQGKEHAVGVLVLICQSSREKYRGLILMEGAMPGLLQLSIDGSWRARGLAQELLMMLRGDCDGGSRGKQWKEEMVERVMQEIDAAEGEEEEVFMGSGGSSTLRLVEEMIAKLST
ncbi:unnamed protein product [Linum trigynum]|uniref:Uncharacterized protein n=1 Tax=Linum trigynum TaxID=586398 RepID=A0AAV2F0E0_9ROSI